MRSILCDVKAIKLICAGLFVVLCAGKLMANEESQIRFGPYAALTINSEVVRGVKVDDVGKIWLLLNPMYRDREIVLKISNEEGANYRDWFNGSKELVSPANQGKLPNQWTDWVETQAPYVEYWMGDQKILHLKKVK